MIARLLIFAVMLALAQFGAHGQQNLSLSSPAPSAVEGTSISATYTGSPGADTFYYWVVARYTIGFAPLAGPARVISVGTIAGGSPVVVSWSPRPGAISYDVLKTTSASTFGSCTCALATGLTVPTTTDTGGALSGYTVGAVSSPVSGSIYIDNQTFTVPLLSFLLNPATTYTIPLVSGTFSTGQVPTYNANGTLSPSTPVSVSTASANTIYSGPTTGAAAAPTFRAMVAADIPDTVKVKNAPCTAATLGTVLLAAGDQCYCSDCQVTTVAMDVVSNATCTGMGTGSLAVLVGMTAKCFYTP